VTDLPPDAAEAEQAVPEDAERPAVPGPARPGPVRLRDVAELAKVHPSTASRALNPMVRDAVNAATVSRVAAAARKLGYQPNSLARGLRLNRTFTIGMLIPDLTNPLFPPIARGTEDRLARDGYTLVLANTYNDEAKERAIVELIGKRRVDGLLLATAERTYPLLDDLRASGVPVVLVNRVPDESPVSSVVGDDHAGIGLAVRHLVSLGHERIAYVGGTQSFSTGLHRYQAFLSWMQSAGLEPDPALIAIARWFRQKPGQESCAELLDRGRPFTAIIAGNDLIALGCYAALRERGLRVPGDISVVGYNGIPFSDEFAPPLTTIRIPHYDIGVRAAELILDAIREEGRGSAVSVRLAPELVVRESTGPPRS
jgi:LacI family transcriptional regulator